MRRSYATHLPALLVLCGLSAAPQAEVLYTLTRVGPAEPGTSVLVNDLNNHGEVVGATSRVVGDRLISRGFLWRDGQTIDLGEPPDITTNSVIAEAINDRSEIVGLVQSTSDLQRGFVWRRGEMTLLPAFEGEIVTMPKDINNWGQIVGLTFSDSFEGRPFLLDGDDFVVLEAPFQTLNGAVSINHRAVIVGDIFTSSG